MDDIGFRDQREVDRYYGRCPDCGDTLRVFKPRCGCEIDWEEPPPQEDSNLPTDPSIPF